MTQYRLLDRAGDAVPAELALKQSPVTRRWHWRIVGSDGRTLMIPTLRGGRLAGWPTPFRASQSAETRLGELGLIPVRTSA